ncbi:MAG: NUDIX hydrolase [Myxococcota bacterium]
MARDPIPTWCIVFAIVHDGKGRFLLIQETDGSWFFPAGPMRRGETWGDAVQRVCCEEGGVPIVLQGVYKMDHRPVQDGARMRAFFLAQPLTENAPKRVPDHHSLGARWFEFTELPDLQLRSLEVLRIIVDLAKGAQIYPLDVLRVEGEVMAMA